MAYTTIHLLGDFIRKERKALAAVLPGHLVELTSAVEDTVQKQSVDGGACSLTVVFEDEHQGNGITVEYPAGSRVQINCYPKGSEFLGRVKDGENITKGDLVTAAGTGEVRKYVAGTDYFPIAAALESIDMSGSSGADPQGFIKLEVL